MRTATLQHTGTLTPHLTTLPRDGHHILLVGDTAVRVDPGEAPGEPARDAGGAAQQEPARQLTGAQIGSWEQHPCLYSQQGEGGSADQLLLLNGRICHVEGPMETVAVSSHALADTGGHAALVTASPGTLIVVELAHTPPQQVDVVVGAGFVTLRNPPP